MDELFEPEIAMDVDEQPPETTKTNGDDASPTQINDSDEVLSALNTVPEAEESNVPEIQENNVSELKENNIPEAEGTTVPEFDENNVPEVEESNGPDVEENNVSEVEEVTCMPEIEAVSCEEQNGEVVTISPDTSEDNVTIPHIEQNGDIVNLDDDDDEEDNRQQTKGTLEQDPIADTSSFEQHSSGLDVIIPDCESILVDETSPTDPAIVNEQDVPKKVKTKRSKELLPAQIPPEFTPEELEIFKVEFGPGKQSVQFLRLHCTACNAHLGSAPNKQHKRFIHPLLKVLICKQCYDFYGSGEFDKDEDGSELYCRWCGQGGKVLCCAKCPFVFCQRCIKVNLGKKKLQEVLDSEDWLCFECVPSQTIRLRVIVRALYDYVQSEIEIAKEYNQHERLKIDNSLCCQSKPKSTPKIKIKLPTLKRKNPPSADNDLSVNDDAYPKKKKIKLKMLSSLLSTPNENNEIMKIVRGQTYINPLAVASRVWESQDEDEVVCTPDLSLLMPLAEEEEGPVETQQPEEMSPPPLAPISTFSNARNDSDVQFVESVQPNNMFPAVRPLPKALGYTLPKNPVVLNASTNRPLLSKVLNTSVPKPTLAQVPVRHKNTGTLPPTIAVVQQNRNNMKVPSKILPGTKFDWFEKASLFTSRVNSNLSVRLASLTKDQSTVTSLEGLATIHNNFQEILNNSIKSLTQIRKNLRNDFIAGLKTLKYNTSATLSKPEAKSNNISDDNDVIIVDAAPPPTQPPVNPHQPVTIGRLKLKPVSQLVDSAIITIPDEVIGEFNASKVIDLEKPPEVTLSVAAKAVTPPLSEPTLQEATDSEPTPSESAPTESAPSEPIEEILNPETMYLIRRALQESKFETIVNENLKLCAKSDIPIDLLKRMLSVRVIVENKFGPATPRIRPRRGYVPMNIRKEDEDDIENMLSSSIVLNVSKRKVFNDSSVEEQHESLLTVGDTVEHLSNGIL